MGMLTFARNALKRRPPNQTVPAPEFLQMLQAVPYFCITNPAKHKVFTDLTEWRAKNYVGELDPVRVVSFIQFMEQVADLPEGDYVEMGTQYGGTAKLIYDLMPAPRQLFCFDTFE